MKLTLKVYISTNCIVFTIVQLFMCNLKCHGVLFRFLFLPLAHILGTETPGEWALCYVDC